MIRAVAFDLDGTLIDSMDAIVDSVFYAFDQAGRQRPPRVVVTKTIGKPLEEKFAQLAPGCDVEQYVQWYRTHYKETAAEKTVLMPGTRELLAVLSKADIRIGFATAKKREMAEMLLAHLDVLSYFTCRIGPAEVTFPKPHPEAVLQCATQLGVPPEELAYVGDMQYDIEAAQRAGAISIAVSTGFVDRETLAACNPDAVFEHLNDVQHYILARL